MLLNQPAAAACPNRIAGQKTKNVFSIVAAFWLIFFGFGTAQQFLVVLFEAQGRAKSALVSLFVLYAVFLACGTVTPKIISWLGLKNSLLAGAASYAIFNFCLNFNYPWLLYATSALIGAGASLFWASSSRIIADNSPKNKTATYLSWQMAALNLGVVSGLVLVSSLSRAVNIELIYRFLFLPIIFGLALLTRIKIGGQKIAPDKFHPFFLLNGKMTLLFPLVFSAYYLQGQAFTGMALIVSSRFDAGFIGIIIAALYAFRLLGSLTSGLMADSFRKDGVLYFLTALGLAGAVLFAVGRDFYALMAGAICSGIFAASTHGVVLSFLKEKLPPEDYSNGISAFFIYTNGGVLTAILANLYLPPEITFAPVIFFLAISFFSVFLANRP